LKNYYKRIKFYAHYFEYSIKMGGHGNIRGVKLLTKTIELVEKEKSK